jgi:hypothetical protein
MKEEGEMGGGSKLVAWAEWPVRSAGAVSYGLAPANAAELRGPIADPMNTSPETPVARFGEHRIISDKEIDAIVGYPDIL